MKSKRPIITSAIVCAFLLACRFVTQPLSSGGTVTDEPSATLPSTPEPTPTAEDLSAPLSGLIYNVYNTENYTNAVWQFDENNAPRLLLANHYFEMLSPDEMQVVYSDYPWGPRESPPCLWIADVKTGNPTTLACSSVMEGDLLPSILGWDSARPDAVLAIVNQTGGGMGGSDGYFGIISLADGSTTVLDPDHPIKNGIAKISPDGTMVAYGSGIYYFDSGYREFDPSLYGVEKAFRAENPSWSPDGKKIAWGLVTDTEGDPPQASLGVFDLEQKTATLILPPFTPQRNWEINEITMPEAIWSPDGQRLAVNVYAEANDTSIKSGWKIVSADGKTLHELDGEFNSWSPDGQWLSYTDWNKDGSGSLLFVSRADGGESILISEVRDNYSPVHWSKNGRIIAFARDDRTIGYANVGEWQVNVVALENIGEGMNVSLSDWTIPLTPWIQ